MDVDLLVLGAGMAGLTAAAQGAQSGLSVFLAEKAETIGGAAALSEGYIWTAPTLEALQAEDPDVDPVLARVLADEFLPAVDWVRELGVDTGALIEGIYRFGHGYRIDIADYIDRCLSVVEGAGGVVRTGLATRELLLEDGGVAGAVLETADGGTLSVRAAATVLATGGFQGSAELRGDRISPAARALLLRALPESDGDGLRLAESAGADFADGKQGFYGHLVPSPLDELAVEDFVSIAVLHSGTSLLFNVAGDRFTDESLGDHENNQVVFEQPEGRALLVADERTRREHFATAYIPGMQSYDKFALAESRGARVASAPTLPGLLEQVARWGYDADRIAETVDRYNSLVRNAPEKLSPPSAFNGKPVEEAPFFALEVQSTITFAYGGVRVDAQARVLRDGKPIPGLYATGADIGGIFTRAYAGSLSRGLVFGRRAALTAASTGRT